VSDGNGAREALREVISDLMLDEEAVDIILLKLAMAGYVVRPLQEN
jgi:hypothetical protein